VNSSLFNKEEPTPALSFPLSLELLEEGFSEGKRGFARWEGNPYFKLPPDFYEFPEDYDTKITGNFVFTPQSLETAFGGFFF
jgi:hypothetical protein